MIRYYYFAFLVFTIFIGCKKEKPIDTQTKNSIDSIPLKYTLVSPSAFYADIDGDGNNDIVITDSVWLYYSNDGHKFWRFRLTTIKSLNLKLQISPGRYSGAIGYFIGLKKDSVINESLWWFDNYFCDGWVWSTPQGYWSEYVGLKIIDNSNVYFGWLHKPGIPGYWNYNSAITEFAIDTSNVVVRNVLAGRKKK